METWLSFRNIGNQALVVAQLAEQLLLVVVEVGCSSKFGHRYNFIMNIFTVAKTKIKKKEAGNGPL